MSGFSPLQTARFVFFQALKLGHDLRSARGHNQRLWRRLPGRNPANFKSHPPSCARKETHSVGPTCPTLKMGFGQNIVAHLKSIATAPTSNLTHAAAPEKRPTLTENGFGLKCSRCAFRQNIVAHFEKGLFVHWLFVLTFLSQYN